MTFSVPIDWIDMGLGQTFILPAETEIEEQEQILWNLSAADTPDNDAIEAQRKFADGLRHLREDHIDSATKEVFQLTKPEWQAVKRAQIKHSKPDPVSGRVVVDENAVIAELLPAAANGKLPSDPVIADHLARIFYRSLFPDKDRLAFLLKR